MRPKRRATRAIAVELSQPSSGRPYFWFFLATGLLALAALIAASKVSRAARDVDGDQGAAALLRQVKADGRRLE
jgi:hypothetical protein